MENNGSRKSIIRNTLWGNANIAVRYLISFIATAIIARHYSPEDFGFYQLILTYVGMLEVVNLLHANHVRNHLVDNPKDENIIAGIWYYQSIGIWFFNSLVITFAALISEEQIFWWLLLLANLRFFFRAYDYVQIIADYHLRNDVTQKIQIVTLGFFNIFRIIISYFSLPVGVLVSSSTWQGLISMLYQLFQEKKMGFFYKKEFLWAKYVQLIKEGGFLTIVLILYGFQLRIVSALAAERMSATIFGNFQLILKLVEPATAIGMIVMTANYTVLAHTLKRDREIFFRRFQKIAFLSIVVASICGLVISIFPKFILLQVFGDAYTQAINNIWMGSLVIIGSTILAISTQMDTILKNYRIVVLKYLLVFISYILFITYKSNLTMEEGLIIQSVVPIFITLFIDLLRSLVLRVF